MAMDDDHADDLLRRALIDQDASAAVALRVGGLALCDALTVVFHGRRDLGTIQTYITHGQRGAGSAVGPDELLRVPCDLDLASARDRDEAETLYAEQAGALRDALAAADTVLAVWQEPFEDLVRTRVDVDRRIVLDVRLPAHRLLPAALVAPDKQIVVTAVCGARPLAEGRPPMGIVCAQQDVARVYPLPDDPERCLEDFLELAAEHARRAGERLDPAGGVGRALPRALGRRLPRSRLVPCRGRAPRHAHHRDRLRDVRLPRHLVPARPRADRLGRRARRGCSTSCARRRAATPTRCSTRAAGVRGRAGVRARDPRAAWRSSSGRGRSRS